MRNRRSREPARRLAVGIVVAVLVVVLGEFAVEVLIPLAAR